MNIAKVRLFLPLCALLVCASLASCTTLTGVDKQGSQGGDNGASQTAQQGADNAQGKQQASPPAQQPTPAPATTTPLDLHTNASITTTQPCHVTKHTDGDTLSVDCLATRIRMIGVDTPETVHPDKPVQCYGQEASERTKQLLPVGATVYLESDVSQGNTDKYDRPLRYIYTADGANVNMELILEGYGHEYTYHTAYKYQTQFKGAQEHARQAHVGLWGAC